MAKPGVSIELSRDGLTGGYQLSIDSIDASGGGHGYRIAGPKFCGKSTTIQRVTLNARDRDEIRRYLDLIPDAPVPAPAGWAVAEGDRS